MHFVAPKIIIKMESGMKATLQWLLLENYTSVVPIDISGGSEVAIIFLRVEKNSIRQLQDM